MKKFIFVFPIVVFALVACKSEQASFTPFIEFSYFYLNPEYEGDKIVRAEDTLSMRQVDDYWVLDSINLTDTVVFGVGYGSYANDLIAARVEYDSLQIRVGAQISDDVRRILLDKSDIRNLQLYINPGYNYLALPMGYKPVQPGNHRIEFIVQSDSEFSPRNCVIYQPVRE
ncbi:MAG: hypothetical protein MJZ75_06930 [Paludibacteraceae bacterium]|nr:hypothetical protein [Paludibacteraceae bacterium]